MNLIKRYSNILIPSIIIISSNLYGSNNLQITKYKIVDTNQQRCFDVDGVQISCKKSNQDGEFMGNTPSYTINENGIVKDNITTLFWQKSPDTNQDGKIDIKDKMSQNSALRYCSDLSLGGYDDWRLPNIKTIYSLIDFSGKDINPSASSASTPFIDNKVFDFAYGDIEAGERIIDAQWATSTNYVSYTMNGDKTMFGVNFADGRIKGYPLKMGWSDKLFYVQCVRGDEKYGQNDFVDNKKPIKWEDALEYCSDLFLGGFNDWKLPNAKELQSIVDYTRSPDTSNSAAIDPIFDSTSIKNEKAQKDNGAYWSSTSHKNQKNSQAAVYISFGKSLGYMRGKWLDVHGAGAQRSDPKDISNISSRGYNKVKDANGNIAITHGPQGDVVRSGNFARCVRTIKTEQKRIKDLAKEYTNNTNIISDKYGKERKRDNHMIGDMSRGFNNQDNMPRQRRQPPREAIEACEDKSLDDSCTIKTPNGRNINGVCAKTPEGVKVCMPKNIRESNSRDSKRGFQGMRPHHMR